MITLQRRRLIAINGLANVAGSLVPIPIILVILPMVLHKVGAPAYGVWALLGTIVAAAQLADFGLGAVVTRHIAFHHSAGDSEAVVETVHSATALYLVIGMVLMAVAVLIWPLLSRAFFRDAPLPAAEIRFLFFASMAVFALTLVVNAFSAILDGLQRIVLNNAIRAGSAIANGIAIYLALEAGWGLRALIAGSVAIIVFRVVALVFVLPYLYPAALTFRPRVSRRRGLEIAGLSSKLSVVQFSGFANYHVAKLFLGAFAPIASVGFYDIASNQLQRVHNLLTGLIYPFIPALAESSGAGPDAVKSAASLYRLSHRGLSIFLVPFLAAVGVFAVWFVRLWLGPQYQQVAPVFWLAGIGTSALILTAPAHYLLIGYGRLNADVERASLGLALNLLFVFTGAKLWGLLGATAGSALASVIATMWLYFRIRRMPVVAAANHQIVRDYLRVVLATLPAALAAAGVLTILPMNWFGFLIAVAVFGLTFVVAAGATGVLSMSSMRSIMLVAEREKLPEPELEPVQV